MKPLDNPTGTQSVPLDDLKETLYAKRQKIYPRQVHGIFANLKITSVMVLLGIYYIFPWLQWDGRQAVLFDLPNRQFYIFGWIFWPQDFIYLALLLIIAGLSLFFFTAIAGRLWCGFACPQTVWTETFLWIERMVEGDRMQQMKLDKQPMSWRKFRLKATKHSAWIAYSLFTGFTFIGYFTPIRELAVNLIPYNLSAWETFWMFFYGFATYGNAGWMREQVCTYMCPYARFQSAMFDKDTMIIAYDVARGEPRGSRKRGDDYKNKGLGDCINCTLCVQVCPTGIDIRNGLQYQCISCSACIDVCDDVMDKMGYSKGLIRYTTENSLEGKPTHVFRPRIMVYGTILLALFVGVIYSISQRVLIQLDVIRDRTSLYRLADDGLIENVYTLKLMNKDVKPHTYTLSVNGVEGIKFGDTPHEITIKGGTIIDLPVSVLVDASNLTKQSTIINFHIQSKDDPSLTNDESSRFLGPNVP